MKMVKEFSHLLYEMLGKFLKGGDQGDIVFTHTCDEWS